MSERETLAVIIRDWYDAGHHDTFVLADALLAARDRPDEDHMCDEVCVAEARQGPHYHRAARAQPGLDVDPIRLIAALSDLIAMMPADRYALLHNGTKDFIDAVLRGEGA